MIYPNDLKLLLDQEVFGQHQAKKALALLGFNYQRARTQEPTLMFRHSLLVGPTGVGKTALVRCLIKHLKAPFLEISAQEMTPYGWNGADVDVIAKKLLKKYPDLPISDLDHAIIFIDEIDKIASRGSTSETSYTHYRQVQSTYLQVLEGCVLGGLDTSKWTFIAAGAFSGMCALNNARPIGYTLFEPSDPPIEALKQQVIDYGFLEEFVGRFGLITQLEDLSWQEYREILTLGPDSIVNEYIRFFMGDNVELHITSTGLEALAKEAAIAKLGVRGLRSLVHQVLTDSLFNLGYNEATPIWITGRTINSLMKKPS